MTIAHNLGFPRFGARREMKKAVEAYWKEDLDRDGLAKAGKEIRAKHWKIQVEAGLDLVPVGDFAWYDHMLNMSALLGVVPERYGWEGDTVDIDTYFRMARGRAPTGEDAPACEMTKWFDTNYHYIVPEFTRDQDFKISSSQIFDEIEEAQKAGYKVKPVLVGPLTYLWLGKASGFGEGEELDRLSLLDNLLPVYKEILDRIKDLGPNLVQLDEPILVLDLPDEWKQAFAKAYEALTGGPEILLTTYFGGLEDNLSVAADLPVAGLHVDLVRAPEQLDDVVNALGEDKVLSAGIINGRNIWRTDLDEALKILQPAYEQLGERLWVGPSCSLLHSPTDLAQEKELDDELKSWLAFAVQKVEEIVTLKRALHEGREAVADKLNASHAANASRKASERIHRPEVKQRVEGVTEEMTRRNSPYKDRCMLQREAINLPIYPTTTIGSFPQTKEIRETRRDYKAGRISKETYEKRMREEITTVVKRQEELELDMLVHGEPERNDMVEYFGELLEGFAFTEHGWVQSYGSRGVKPPIIYGDVSRPGPMTVEWSKYAQSITDKPMKGMLTGPVTILQWSFVRDDQPRSETCKQIGLALRDEVVDLEAAGIKAIQIDEPAIREGLPLRQKDWQDYLDWAVESFRLTASGVKDQTQIHTHMCYSEFNDIIESIAALDADVITIETSRSQMELLEVFKEFNYPNEIGPGVYDIHSPRVPQTQDMVELMEKAAERVVPERLWVNPDCGLKTRGWPEVKEALGNMVQAAKTLRGAA